MPVAGNVLYSVELNFRNGVLAECAWMHRSSSVVETDVPRAIDKLRRGDIVYVQAYGNNISEIRDALLGGLK